MKVDDVDLIAVIVQLVCSDEVDDDLSVSTRR